MFDFEWLNFIIQYDLNNLPIWGIAAVITYFFILILSLEKGVNKGIPIDYSFHLVTFSTIGSLLGGRFVYLLIYQQNIDWASILNWNDIFYKGNLNIVGGYLGGLLLSWFYLRGFDVVSSTKKSWLIFFDSFLEVIPIGLTFGYIGVFLSNINKGLESSADYPWLVFFNGKQIHPWGLYLAFGYLILFTILYTLNSRTYSFRRPGYITSFFVVGASIIHFVVDFWQSPSYQYGLPRIAGLTTTQWFASITICVAIIVVLLFRSKIETVYSEENIEV